MKLTPLQIDTIKFGNELRNSKKKMKRNMLKDIRKKVNGFMTDHPGDFNAVILPDPKLTKKELDEWVEDMIEDFKQQVGLHAPKTPKKGTKPTIVQPTPDEQKTPSPTKPSKAQVLKDMRDVLKTPTKDNFFETILDFGPAIKDTIGVNFPRPLPLLDKLVPRSVGETWWNEYINKIENEYKVPIPLQLGSPQKPKPVPKTPKEALLQDMEEIEEIKDETQYYKAIGNTIRIIQNQFKDIKIPVTGRVRQTRANVSKWWKGFIEEIKQSLQAPPGPPPAPPPPPGPPPAPPAPPAPPRLNLRGIIGAQKPMLNKRDQEREFDVMLAQMESLADLYPQDVKLPKGINKMPNLRLRVLLNESKQKVEDRHGKIRWDPLFIEKGKQDIEDFQNKWIGRLPEQYPRLLEFTDAAKKFDMGDEKALENISVDDIGDLSRSFGIPSAMIAPKAGRAAAIFRLNRLVQLGIHRNVEKEELQKAKDAEAQASAFISARELTEELPGGQQAEFLIPNSQNIEALRKMPGKFFVILESGALGDEVLAEELQPNKKYAYYRR